MAIKLKNKSETTAAVPTIHQGEIIPKDKLFSIVGEIEKLSTEEAALEKGQQLMHAELLNWYQLGGVLSTMKRNEWFCGHKSFEELINHEFGFRPGKGYYLSRIYDTLVEANITWDMIKDIGPNKLRVLCGKHRQKDMDPKQFLYVVQKSKDLTVEEIKHELLPQPTNTDDTGAAVPSSIPPPDNKTTTLTFKPHADQAEMIAKAIAMAKQLGNTEYDTVALGYICTEFVATSPDPDDPNQVAQDEKQVVHLFKKMDAARILILFREVFPDIDVEVSVPGGTEEAA